MINKILIVFALVASFTFANAQSASAGKACDATGICGTVRHAADSGYDAPIIVRCVYGTGPKKYVPEGFSSKKWCRDTDQVYVRSNEEVWCLYWIQEGVGTGHYSYLKQFDAQGWHKITDHFNKKCIVKRD